MQIVTAPPATRNTSGINAGWDAYRNGLDLASLADPDMRRGWLEAESGERACLMVDRVFARGGTAADADRALACGF